MPSMLDLPIAKSFPQIVRRNAGPTPIKNGFNEQSITFLL
jgi:hypothetical protein